MLIINLYTSDQGLHNHFIGKKMFAYRDKSEMNNLSISIPADQVEKFNSHGEFVIKERGFTADMDVQTCT